LVVVVVCTPVFHCVRIVCRSRSTNYETTMGEHGSYTTDLS
jgi:hypothetical protein